MRHLDLFSGIGGFSLAAEEIWGNEYECVGFCDINTFAQNSLRKNFPGVEIYGDIRTLTNTDSVRSQEQRAEQQTDRLRQPYENIDLLTGGFPCQPFSVAGKQKGKDDERYLWPEMLRVIREYKPRWIVGENVTGIINLALEQVCLDLEAEGYEVQPFIIPACAVNAPHRRDRVWVIAHSNNSRSRTSKCDVNQNGSKISPEREQPQLKPRGSSEDAPNSESERLEGRSRGEQGEYGDRGCCARSGREWDKNWHEVATRFCRMDDGLPRRMVILPDGSSISEAKWRQEALKAYGNTIVPLVATEIFRNIKIVDELYQVIG